MRSIANERDEPASWDVARPARPGVVAGVDMAGFCVPGLSGGGLRPVPHPAVTLILEFGASRPVVEDGTGRRLRGSMVAGPGFGAGGAVRARGELGAGTVECVQVRLSPVVARAVLGVSPADLAGGPAALDELWGREASRIREQLGEASSWQERFALTETLIARKYQNRKYENRPPTRPDPEVARAWRRIVVSHGRVRVDGLAAELGWSRTRLWSRFHAQLGMSPKRAAKLVRFDRAVHRLVAGEAAARVAAEGGYYDQPHLHRDVRAFTGLTLTAVAGEPFLTVDERAWPDGRPPVRARPGLR